MKIFYTENFYTLWRSLWSHRLECYQLGTVDRFITYGGL